MSTVWAKRAKLRGKKLSRIADTLEIAVRLLEQVSGYDEDIQEVAYKEAMLMVAESLAPT